MVFLLGFVSTAQAMILAHTDVVEISPGELLTHIVDWQRPPGLRIEVRLIEAPAGARLLVDQSGELYVKWQSGLDMSEENVFVLVARDVDTELELERSRLLVMRKAELVDRITDAEPKPPALELFDHQYLQVGIPWHFVINVDGISNEPVDIQAKGLPSGAIMSSAPDGNYDIDWTPVKGQHGRRQITIRAAIADRPSVFIEQALMMTVEPEPVVEEAVSWNLPQLDPLANQIISAGRVVSFRVKPTIKDGTRAFMQVDRLPRNASFDENQDGSRTFYWQTSNKDQGEHLFRFTAIHPKDANLRAWREILIVVGDPSRSTTAPVDERQSSIE